MSSQNQEQMPAFKKAILLIILSLHTIIIFAQENIFFSDSIKARGLYSSAINLGRNSMHDEALDSFFLCLDIRKHIYGEIHEELGLVYNGIAIQYRSMGEYDLALKYYKLTEQNFQSSSRFSTRVKTRLYSNIGNVYRSKLDFNQALQYFNRTLEIYKNERPEADEEIAYINSLIADIYYLTNDYSKALELLYDNIENAYSIDQVSFYELLAYIYQDQNNYTEAKKNYQKMIELSVSLIEYGEMTEIEVAIKNLNYITFLIDFNKFEEANLELNNAFEIINNFQPTHGYELAEYNNLKGLYFRKLLVEKQSVFAFAENKKDNLLEAIKWYKKALMALKFPKEYSIKSVEHSDDWISLFNCIDYLKNMADVYKEIAEVEQNKQSDNYINSLNQALEHYKIAGALIQKARKEITSDESKIQLTELEYNTFQNLVATAFDAFKATQKTEFIELAFQSAERTKSSSVFDKLSNDAAQENSLIPDSLIHLENKYNNTISIYSQKLFEENNEITPNDSIIQVYDSLRFEATRNREELNRILENEYSDYYDLKYSNSMLTLTEIQQKLNEEETILEYVLNENDSATALYTFVISKNNIDFSKQDVGINFSKSVEVMFHFMSDPEYMFTTNSESKQFCVAANNLYKKLIFPFNRAIQNQNITVVPDGKLSYIAFDALLQNLPDTTQAIRFNNLDYLIKDFTINYSNSTNLLFKENNSSKKLKNKALAFAPEYNNDTIEIANQKIVLAPLPGVLKEVDMVAETINTKIFKQSDATETNFRNNAQNYDILHLAMHAYINDSLPSFSRLAFTRDTASNLRSDGWINTSDIYNLDLNARLTVLSACNTGSGQLKKGEGILSLARGFFYAGCPSLVMSLWEVEDQSGTEIMGAFYKNLKKGKKKDEALRLAKLSYLENANSRRAHPHYWLGYVSIGDNASLYKSYDFYFFSILIFALLAISIDQLIRIRKGRKKTSL